MVKIKKGFTQLCRVFCFRNFVLLNKRQKAKGFTLIELMIVVGIIAIVVSIILTMAITRARDKAAVVSYKTSMQSLRTSIELCLVGGGQPSMDLGRNKEGEPICYTDDTLLVAANGSEFPAMRNKCNDYSNLRYAITKSLDPTVKWKLSTTVASGTGDNWDCRGCHAVCDTNECIFTPKTTGDCY